MWKKWGAYFIYEDIVYITLINIRNSGDILNIIGIESREIAYIFRKFSPVERMIISRDNGLLNDYFSIVKGQLIDLYYFATIGEMENDQPEDFEATKDPLKEITAVLD